MSSNKNKYFEVTTSVIVKAPNKTEALSVASRKRGASGEILSTDTWVENLTAASAKVLTA